MLLATIALVVGVAGCATDRDAASDPTTGATMAAPARLEGATTGNPRLGGTLDLSVVTELGTVAGPAGRVIALDDRGATWSIGHGDGESSVGDGSAPGVLLGHIAVDPLRMVSDALPDGRPVWWGTTMVVLVQPTERYGHGVLGDAVEAGGFEILDLAAEPSPTVPHPDVVERTRVVTRAPAVIEGVAALLVDLDGDGRPEIVTTESDAEVGARLVVHDLDGALLARGEPVGRGNRWRNQLGAGPLGPDDEIELVDVETPHIGGVVQWFGLQDGELRHRSGTDSYSTHRIGSRILDQGLIVDVTGDGRPEVLVPTQDQRRLVALSRTSAGVSEVAGVDLPARLSSNLAGLTTADGGVVVAVGLEDGTILRLGTPTPG